MPDTLSRLNHILTTILPANAFYQRKLGTLPEFASTGEYSSTVPFTTKEELAADHEAHPPYGTHLTFPPETYHRFHQTSGTCGKPLIWLDDPGNWTWILDNWEWVWRGAGVKSGDDASCFNLNSITRPRLLATDTAALAQRGSLTIKSTAPGIEASWNSLRGGDPGVLRAFIDETTLLWVLKKKPGDRIDYTDEQGATFPVEIAGTLAGTLAGSVFQGSFIVDEQPFLERFPSTGGYQLFLAEAPGDLSETRAILQRTLTDLGATITTTAERLAAFNSFENTYISIFNVIAGLGVILGAAGLDLVTARNLAERKNEFAQLHQLGIPKRILRSLVVRETRRFILWAVAIGLIAALISILPALPATGLATTLGWITVLAVLFLMTATACAWFAYRRSALFGGAAPP